MERDILLKRIKEVVLGFDPEAEVILYGSRARGDWSEDSDWDLLVLLSEEPERGQRESIEDSIYKIELEVDEILVPIIRSKSFWHSPRACAMQFHENVDRDGVTL